MNSSAEFLPSESSRQALMQKVHLRAHSFVATLVVLDGMVQIRDNLSVTSRPGIEGLRISRDVLVEVTKGRALLRMDDGSDVWLQEGSLLDLSSWKADQRRLELRFGHLLAMVVPLSRALFRVSSPAGQVIVTGTAFEFRASATNILVAVLHGSVQVTNRHGQFSARRGMQVRASTATSPMRDQSMPRPNLSEWGNKLGASATNQAIRKAFRAVEKEQIHQQKEIHMKPNTKKKFAVALALAAVGLGAYQANQFWGAASEPAESPAADSARSKQRKMVRVPMGPDGKPDFSKKTVMTGSEGISGMSGDEEIGPEGLSPESIDRDLTAGRSAIDALVAQGIPKAEAEARVSKSLTDAVSRQANANGTNRPVNVQVRDGKAKVQIGGGQSPGKSNGAIAP